MNRLNYFNPYNSKEATHEDQLTRAFLALLKHSFHAFAAFYDYCREAYDNANSSDQVFLPLREILPEEIRCETQKSNPQIETNWLLSVLMTDDAPSVPTKEVSRSEREARYDGIISFGDVLTIVIENKPRSGNVWAAQLDPTKKNMSDDTKLFKTPCVIEWKEIVRCLGDILPLATVSGSEKMMIEDFRDFLDSAFPHLNPHDSFDLCKGNDELLHHRIKRLLELVSKDPNMVKYHNGWGYYIEVPFFAIKKVGLIKTQDDAGRWSLDLSLFFGDSQNQATSFYRSKPILGALDTSDWDAKPNFHVAFSNSNLVWFESPDKAKYLAYWIDHADNIHQLKRAQVRDYLEQLEREGIIQGSDKSHAELNRKFWNTKMSTLNVCPGFGLKYHIDQDTAERLDKTGELIEILRLKIMEGLTFAKEDGASILAPRVQSAK